MNQSFGGNCPVSATNTLVVLIWRLVAVAVAVLGEGGTLTAAAMEKS